MSVISLNPLKKPFVVLKPGESTEVVMNMWEANATLGNITVNFVASDTLNVEFYGTNIKDLPEDASEYFKDVAMEDIDLWTLEEFTTITPNVSSLYILGAPLTKFIKMKIINTGSDKTAVICEVAFS